MTTATKSQTDSVKLQTELAPETQIKLHELVARKEDGTTIVGRAETGEFVALPKVGGQIIELIIDQQAA